MLKVFGYQKNNEDLMELQEVSFQSDIKELDKLINFLQEVKEEHSKIIGEGLCHSHFRDWDTEWKTSSADIIVVTTKSNNS